MGLNAADDVASAMHGMFGGLGMALAVGMQNRRNLVDARAAHAATCSAASARAAGRVYAATAAALREQLADADEDVAFLREEVSELKDKLAMLCSFIAKQQSEGRIAV